MGNWNLYLVYNTKSTEHEEKDKLTDVSPTGRVGSFALWRHLVTWNLVDYDSGNAFFPDGTKLLQGPTLTNHQWSLVGFAWGQFHI